MRGHNGTNLGTSSTRAQPNCSHLWRGICVIIRQWEANICVRHSPVSYIGVAQLLASSTLVEHVHKSCTPSPSYAGLLFLAFVLRNYTSLALYTLLHDSCNCATRVDDACNCTTRVCDAGERRTQMFASHYRIMTQMPRHTHHTSLHQLVA